MLYAVEAYGTKFLFEVSLTDDIIYIWLIADSTDFSYKFFTCKYEFLNACANGGYLLEKPASALGKYDWFSKIKLVGPRAHEIKIKFFVRKKV